jgi:hypothetical protein
MLKRDEEEKGIQAIIDLQKIAGITETPEKAKIGWNAMNDYDKETTLAAHKVLC